MAAYLITGRSGTGKSTICKELTKRGYVSFDGDEVPGLAAWESAETGKKIGKAYPGHDHVNKFKWTWEEAVLDRLLSQPGDVFLCGSANNALNFMHKFKKVFVLDIPEHMQRHRINTREEHDYGKELSVQNSIIEYQKETVAQASTRGAIIMDASSDVEQVVEKMLTHINLAQIQG